MGPTDIEQGQPSYWQYQQDPDDRPISTRDLISWAYQIARGMDYLASRKVRLSHLLPIFTKHF